MRRTFLPFFPFALSNSRPWGTKVPSPGDEGVLCSSTRKFRLCQHSMASNFWVFCQSHEKSSTNLSLIPVANTTEAIDPEFLKRDMGLHIPAGDSNLILAGELRSTTKWLAVLIHLACWSDWVMDFLSTLDASIIYKYRLNGQARKEERPSLWKEGTRLYSCLRGWLA